MTKVRFSLALILLSASVANAESEIIGRWSCSQHSNAHEDLSIVAFDFQGRMRSSSTINTVKDGRRIHAKIKQSADYVADGDTVHIRGQKIKLRVFKIDGKQSTSGSEATAFRKGLMEFQSFKFEISETDQRKLTFENGTGTVICYGGKPRGFSPDCKATHGGHCLEIS